MPHPESFLKEIPEIQKKAQGFIREVSYQKRVSCEKSFQELSDQVIEEFDLEEE